MKYTELNGFKICVFYYMLALVCKRRAKISALRSKLRHGKLKWNKIRNAQDGKKNRNSLIQYLKMTYLSHSQSFETTTNFSSLYRRSQHYLTTKRVNCKYTNQSIIHPIYISQQSHTTLITNKDLHRWLALAFVI